MVIVDRMPAKESAHPGANGAVSVDPWKQSAQELAQTHRAVRMVPGKHLLFLDKPQLQSSLLQQAYQHFAAAAQTELAVSYAGEWMLDNFYIIQQANRQIREDVPAKYYHELPKLADT